ncbi:hypothetical protein RFI_10643 [Reticulomyxa filosa]|uniref:Uncharacterized protein n=1 Tax=Reticulomyxa filosa TaxID=46433 RepID=X6NLB0_RETFI|nr:hypothetical protein RFI_10643 [Reticulomyxa filosa]|eukprot:ETO26494.1 hypothetical protein RFI_10643 [Reticulomyxa filosa]
MCQVHDSCRINWANESGWLIFDEGMVWGGYCEVMFYPDNSDHKSIKIFGGSLFNRKLEECRQKFNEVRNNHEIFGEVEGDGEIKGPGSGEDDAGSENEVPGLNGIQQNKNENKNEEESKENEE